MRFLLSISELEEIMMSCKFVVTSNVHADCRDYCVPTTLRVSKRSVTRAVYTPAAAAAITRGMFPKRILVRCL